MIGFAAEGDRAVVQIFPLRGGKMVDRHSFHLENVGGQDVTTILESFGLEYYGSAPSVPPQIVVPRDAGDLSALAELLGERRGARVEIRTAERGEKRRLQRLADENALHVLSSDVAQSEARRLRRVEALEQLRETLNLECAAAPHRVLRHLDRDGPGQRRLDGRLPGRPPEEGALPQVRDQGPGGDGRLRGDGGDGLAAVRAAREGPAADEYDESFAATPNLVVVDGGKGQLAAALAAMQAFDLPRVAVIALAKREEEVFVPGQARPVVLSAHDPGCSSCSVLGMKRTVSPSASIASAASRGASPRCSTSSRASGRRGGARCSSTSARSMRCSPPHRRSSRACPASPQKSRGRSTPSSTRRAVRAASSKAKEDCMAKSTTAPGEGSGALRAAP